MNHYANEGFLTMGSFRRLWRAAAPKRFEESIQILVYGYLRTSSTRPNRPRSLIPPIWTLLSWPPWGPTELRRKRLIWRMAESGFVDAKGRCWRPRGRLETVDDRGGDVWGCRGRSWGVSSRSCGCNGSWKSSIEDGRRRANWEVADRIWRLWWMLTGVLRLWTMEGVDCRVPNTSLTSPKSCKWKWRGKEWLKQSSFVVVVGVLSGVVSECYLLVSHYVSPTCLSRDPKWGSKETQTDETTP